MEDCIFCKIIAQEIPANILYEDEDTCAFHDINPQAPYHILVIPKKHYENMAQMDIEAIGRLLQTATEIARTNKCDKQGYRLVINTGTQAGQSVFHTHVHLLSGRKMNWPPG